MKAILSNKLFLFTFLSDILSNFGDVLYYLALMNYVVQLPDAKFALSMVTLSETVPIMTGFFIGIWADKTLHKVNRILLTLIFRMGLYVLVGLVMGFPPALWIVLVAVVVNLLGDISGQYENGLYIPISLKIVSDEDREVALGFKQSVSAVSNVAFQSAGAFLITLMTYSQLAFTNAATFFVSFLIITSLRPSLNRLLEQPSEVTIEHKKDTHESWFKRFISNIKMVLSEMSKIPECRLTLVIIPFLNGVLAVTETLLVLLMSQNKQFVLFNPATTLATISVIMVLGTALGGLLVSNLFKRTSIIFLVRLVATFPTFLFLAFLLNNIYLLFLSEFMISFIAGLVNPKFYALMLNTMPEDKIATISMGFSSYCQIGQIFSLLLVSGLVLFLKAEIISFIFLVLSILLLGYTIIDRKKSRR